MNSQAFLGLTAAYANRNPCRAQRQRVSHQHHLRQQATSTAEHHVGSLDASNLNFAIVVGRFNDLVTKLLLDGALDAFRRHGAGKPEVKVQTAMF